MTTVPNDGFPYSPSTLIYLVTIMFRQALGTWYCTSWVPWIRYVLTIIVIVIAVVSLAAGLGFFLSGLVL